MNDTAKTESIKLSLRISTIFPTICKNIKILVLCRIFNRILIEQNSNSSWLPADIVNKKAQFRLEFFWTTISVDVLEKVPAAFYKIILLNTNSAFCSKLKNGSFLLAKGL